MVIPALLGLLITALIDGPEIDEVNFQRLVAGQYSNLRDVTVVFEGERRYVGSPRTVKGNPIQFSQSYQGTYAWRSDGATLLDVFHKGFEPDGKESPLVRKTFSYFGEKKESFVRIPDLKQTTFQTSSVVGRAGLFDTGSFARIFFSWHLGQFKNSPDSGYKFLGWELVDGHRCLVVEFNLLARAVPENNPVQRFWIDLERGAHPLRYEIRGGNALETRVEGIVLSEHQVPGGKRVWLPIRGEYQDFGRRAWISTSPLFVETYSVVGGSVRINQGLPDEMFSARWNGNLAGTDEMKYLRRLTLNVPKQPRGRTDPVGVKKNLDRMLVEADRQSKMLEASSAAREVWGWTPILQVVFVTAGIALLIGIVLYKKKMA